jgi:hypothetical protein
MKYLFALTTKDIIIINKNENKNNKKINMNK